MEREAYRPTRFADDAVKDRAADILLDANLPKRAVNALIHGGVRTLEEAAEWSDRDLLSLPHFGPASVASLRALIAARHMPSEISACHPARP
jgi:hypothetical protein